MNASDIQTLADQNLAEAAREMVRWQRDHHIEEREDLLFVAGADSFPDPYSNCVMALGPRASEDPERLIALADEHFGGMGRVYAIWIRDHLDANLEAVLKDAGLSPLSDSPGMVLEAPIPDRPQGVGLRVEQVEGTDAARALGGVEALSYASLGLPAENTERIFSMPERFINPHTIVVLGYLENRPVSAAIAILSHGIAGLYWVGTCPEARGHGLGEACTRLAGNRAFELGARCVVLQASAQGEPIYLRMGYREITRYRWYLRAPQHSGA